MTAKTDTLRLISSLNVLLGFAFLALTTEFGPGTFVVGLLGVAAAWGIDSGLIPFRPAPWVWNALLAIPLTVIAVELLVLGEPFLIALGHFFILLQLYLLLQPKSASDHARLQLLSFCFLLLASTLTTTVAFGGVFVLYLLVGTWSLILFHLRREMDRRPGEAGRAPALLTPSFLVVTASVSLAAFAFTLAFFVVIPRVGAGFFKKRATPAIHVVGFSDRVQLGTMGEILSDSTAVMRIKIDNRAALRTRPLWRGASFETYDGQEWSRGQYRGLIPVRQRRGSFPVGGPASGPTVRQRVWLEPLNTTVLFALPRPVLVQEVPGLYADLGDALHLPSLPQDRLSYVVHSDLSRPSGAQLAADTAPYPPAILERYLQVPPGEERTAALARSLTEGKPSAYAKALAIERYLQGLRYSLKIDRDERYSPVEDFLFVQRRGYCEQFATAMVLMLRAVGIPSRPVSGFLAGEWNEVGGYYLVRQSDAHLWVEVYFPGHGWIPFDPTPRADAETVPVLSTVMQYLDALRMQWNRYVIHYQLGDQLALLRTLREMWQEGTQALVLQPRLKLPGLGWPPPLRAPAALLVIALLAAGLVAFGLARRRWPVRRPTHGQGRTRVEVAFYARMLRLLARRGLRREPSQTPLEFARGMLARSREAGADVLRLTGLYYRVRYGGKALTAAEADEVEQALQRLRVIRA